MGLSYSRRREIFNDTPQTPLNDGVPRKILPFDPRSPSKEIVRTPIQVEQTPKAEPVPFTDHQSLSSDVNRTPVAASEETVCKNEYCLKDSPIGINAMYALKRPKQLFHSNSNQEVSMSKSSNHAAAVHLFNNISRNQYARASGLVTENNKENNPI